MNADERRWDAERDSAGSGAKGQRDIVLHTGESGRRYYAVITLDTETTPREMRFDVDIGAAAVGGTLATTAAVSFFARGQARGNARRTGDCTPLYTRQPSAAG